MKRTGGLLLALSLFVACEGDTFAPAPGGTAGSTAGVGAPAGTGGVSTSAGAAGRSDGGAGGASAGEGGNVQAAGNGPFPAGAGGDGPTVAGHAGDGPGGAGGAGTGGAGVGGGGQAGASGAGTAGMAGNGPSGGKSGAAGASGSGGAGGVSTTCKDGTTVPCALHACETAGEKKCVQGSFGACAEREDKVCGGSVDVDCNGVPGDAPSCTKVVYMQCRGGDGGPGCDGNNDCLISGSADEGKGNGYTQLTSFRLLTKETTGALAVRRCKQDGTNVHRTAIGADCSSTFMFKQEGPIVGYLLAPAPTPPAAGYRKIYGGGDVPPVTGNYWLMTAEVCAKTCDCTVANNDHLVVGWAPP